MISTIFVKTVILDTLITDECVLVAYKSLAFTANIRQSDYWSSFSQQLNPKEETYMMSTENASTSKNSSLGITTPLSFPWFNNVKNTDTLYFSLTLEYSWTETLGFKADSELPGTTLLFIVIHTILLCIIDTFKECVVYFRRYAMRDVIVNVYSCESNNKRNMKTCHAFSNHLPCLIISFLCYERDTRFRAYHMLSQKWYIVTDFTSRFLKFMLIWFKPAFLSLNIP